MKTRRFDKPQGLELAATLALKRLTGKLDQIHKPLETAEPFAHGDFQTQIEFALDAVRTNGWQRLHTAWDALEALRRYREEVRDGLAAFTKADTQIERLTRQAERIMAAYKLCPKCKGKNRRNTGRNEWTDCATCDGRGMIKA